MENSLIPMPASITQVKPEGQQTKLLVLKLVNSQDRDRFEFIPGQFLQLSVPGFGEAPFSIASDPKNRERLEILVQSVGSLTKRLYQAKRGDLVGIRGPLGNGFPLEKLKNKNIVFVSGGCGIVPMRSLMLDIQNRQKEFGKISFFYGCKTPQELFFSSDYPSWKESADLCFIVEKPDSSWHGPTGMVTDLLKKAQLNSQDRAVICGPLMMIKFVIKELIKQHLRPNNIYLSLERRMSCGIGICQHCVIGSKYVCKDGPIFSLSEIREEEPSLFQ